MTLWPSRAKRTATGEPHSTSEPSARAGHIEEAVRVDGAASRGDPATALGSKRGFAMGAWQSAAAVYESSHVRSFLGTTRAACVFGLIVFTATVAQVLATPLLVLLEGNAWTLRLPPQVAVPLLVVACAGQALSTRSPRWTGNCSTRGVRRDRNGHRRALARGPPSPREVVAALVRSCYRGAARAVSDDLQGQVADGAHRQRAPGQHRDQERGALHDVEDCDRNASDRNQRCPEPPPHFAPHVIARRWHR